MVVVNWLLWMSINVANPKDSLSTMTFIKFVRLLDLVSYLSSVQFSRILRVSQWRFLMSPKLIVSSHKPEASSVQFLQNRLKSNHSEHLSKSRNTKFTLSLKICSGCVLFSTSFVSLFLEQNDILWNL
jgi:hypothetical protein